MHRPTVRSSIVSDYAPFARACGLDPQAMLRSAGLPARCLTQPDLRIPVGKVNRLLEASASASGTPDFGLQLSRTRRLSSLGALGALMRDEQSVRKAVERSITSAHLNSNAIWMQLTDSDGVAVLQLTLDTDKEPVISQGTEMALGGLFRILQHLLSATWKPREVYFMHGPVSSLGAYRRFFGCPVHFGAEFNALVFPSEELDQAIPLSDGRLRRYASLALAEAAPRRQPVTVHTTKQQILALLPDGLSSSSAVAASLNIDRRTLNRHLEAEGVSFSQVSNAFRLELAQQYLAAGRLDVSQTADLLGFHSLSAFSRWFKHQTGQPPTRWLRSKR